MQEISIQLSTNRKEKPQDENALGFGSIFTDHMFLMNYDRDLGWHDARIVPYGDISLSPAAKCLHYGQEVFEGLKAYRTAEGNVQLFRPRANFKRLNYSNKRIAIPQVDEEFCVHALKKLIEIEQDWVPSLAGTSLYIRPFIIGTEGALGTDSSDHYMLGIILSPSGAYYKTGLNPVGIHVENNYVRAVKGGTGFAKTGGNYAASLLAQEEAHEEGYAQVLWLDGIERKYIEEVGAMNIFFRIGNEVITPSLQGSILPGITRDSVITMCKDWGYTVSEKTISIDEIAEAYKDGKLTEVFGTGTAAVISPVGKLKYNDLIMNISEKTGELAQKLYDSLTGMQYGRLEDTHNWIVKI